MNDLLARVRPLVGEALDICQVAVMGSPAAGALVEYLVACGVRRWLVMEGNQWIGALVTKVRERYGNEIDISVCVVGTVEEVGAADLALVVDDGELACRLPATLTRLEIFTSIPRGSSRALLVLPGEIFTLPEGPSSSTVDGWDWLTSAPLMALAARALLLRGTVYAMATWEEAWAKGTRLYRVGAFGDPTRATWQANGSAVEDEQHVYRTVPQRRGTLLIAGLGSLGSLAAQQLAPWVERLVLVDSDRVELANLVRQAYSHHQLGEAKATALAHQLCAAQNGSQPGLVCEAVVASLTDDEAAAELIARYGVTAALVTTGTHADFAISRAARSAAIPHVVGRCYARARFWEGIVVDGVTGPSYEQVRRQVAAGPTPAPTPEEVAAYGAAGELVGEPATLMETGWAAMWLARLTMQLMTPVTLREGWLLARLAAGATCFVGGLVVEEGRDGAAYGISTAGEVHAWSVEEIG